MKGTHGGDVRRLGGARVNRATLGPLRIATAVVAASLAACGSDDGDREPPRDEQISIEEGTPSAAVAGEVAYVVAIVDGDTLDVIADGSLDRVRILGIDAPEVHPDAECGGLEAWDSLARLAPPGSEVILSRDSIQPAREGGEPGGRLLRYVESDGVDIGREQIRSGLALACRRADSDRRADYERVEMEARTAGRGVHGELC